jgi:transposase
MDNTSIHHVDRVVTTIQQTGVLVRFLPPYNPIEEMFSEVKAYLKANELANVAVSPEIFVVKIFS